MVKGSMLQCVQDFSDLANFRGIDYPKLGEIVTVSSTTPHPNKELRKLGIVLVHLVQYPNHPTGICIRQEAGKPNFIELPTPFILPIDYLSVTHFSELPQLSINLSVN